MQTYLFTLQPVSAFGTPLAGDTLFGQLCWTLRNLHGNDRLNSLLEGYTSGAPFAVVSDAMPAGHIPLPNVPPSLWATQGDANRKLLKRKRWLPQRHMVQPFELWQETACGDAEVAPFSERAQPHNTINRQTGTTGDGSFAPYAQNQIWFKAATRFDLHVVLDETRLTLLEFTAALRLSGLMGFGRDASIGLGKFRRISDAATLAPFLPDDANCYLTLGPVAPQGQGFCPVRSFYQVVTRFGRHGDAAVQSGNPFKRPILMAKAGGVFWPEVFNPMQRFIGQGLGGLNNPLSTVMPETVHQGYAPVIAIHRPIEVRA